MKSKLELGCGDNPMNSGDDWERMDSVNYPCVTIVGNIKHIPAPDNSFDEIYSHWVIEHIHRNELALYIREWKRVLKVGGIMTHVTNNEEAICRAVLTGVISWNEWNYLTFANIGTFEELHKIGFSPDYLKEFFTEEGMEIMSLNYETVCKENGKLSCPGITIKARKVK